MSSRFRPLIADTVAVSASDGSFRPVAVFLPSQVNDWSVARLLEIGDS